MHALGANDDARWSAWLGRQLNPDTIADSACDARIASAGFVTLNKSGNQLWNDHHAVTNDYYLRMLPIREVECMSVIRQTYSARQLKEVMVDFWHDHFSVFGWDYDGGPMFPEFDPPCHSSARLWQFPHDAAGRRRVGIDDVHARPVFE